MINSASILLKYGFAEHVLELNWKKFSRKVLRYGGKDI